jgi:hypothetical protein
MMEQDLDPLCHSTRRMHFQDNNIIIIIIDMMDYSERDCPRAKTRLVTRVYLFLCSRVLRRGFTEPGFVDTVFKVRFQF